jgi:O-antigen/teichoic acid export membrane protein
MSDTTATEGWRKREISLAFVNSLKLGSSLVLTWAIALVTRLYIPRFLGPERFGTLNFADAFTATAFVAMGLGIDTYVRKEISVRPEHAKDFIGGVVATRLLLLLLVYAGMETVLRVTHCDSEVRSLVYIYGMAQFFMVGGFTSAGLLQAIGKVNEMSVLSVVVKIAWAFFIFIAIVFHLGLWAFALTVTITEGAKSLVLFALARKYLNLDWRVRVRATRTAIVAALPFYVSGLATTVYDKMGVNLLEFMTTRREVGWFGAASGFASMTLLFAPLMSWVLIPLFARSAAESVGELYRMVRRSLELVLSLAIPVSMLMLVGADIWISVAFGKAFSPAAMALRVLSIATLLMYVSIVAAYAMAVLNYTWRMSLTFVGGMIINPTTNLIFIPRMSAAFGPGGGGFACAVATLVTEIAIVISLLLALGSRCFDRRLIVASLKNLGAAVLIIVVDSLFFTSLGPIRLAIDAGAYALVVLWSRAFDLRGLLEIARTAIRQRKLRKSASTS